jgi:ribosomal protein S18 acetylase RimI-like enzyme
LAQAASIDWQGRLAAGCSSELDRPIVVDVGGISVGLAWGKVSPDAPERADVFQMWVDPEFRGRGAASLLVRDLLAWARGLGVRCICLGVTCGDTPARRLYQRAGFLPVGEPEAMQPGSQLLFQTMRYDFERAG